MSKKGKSIVNIYFKSHEIDLIDEIKKIEGKSRAQIMREAIGEYLNDHYGIDHIQDQKKE